MADWSADVAALADHLRSERFTVTGASSGGPYAVACAALLADRVATVGVVCGATDFGWAGAWENYPRYEAELMCVADEVEAVAWCEARYGHDGLGFLERGVLLSGITFGAGAVCFAVGVSRSGLLATAPARLVAVALIVMALSRFVPLSAVQFYVQGLACYAALLPLAYFMWRRPSVASHVPNAAPQPSADWRHQRASDPNRA